MDAPVDHRARPRGDSGACRVGAAARGGCLAALARLCRGRACSQLAGTAPLSLQVHVAKVDADGKAIRGQEDTYAICGYVRDKVRVSPQSTLWPRARLRATDEPLPPRTMCWLRRSSVQNICLHLTVPSLLSLSLSPLRPQGEADMALTQLIKAQEEKEGKEGKSLKGKGL